MNTLITLFNIFLIGILQIKILKNAINVRNKKQNFCNQDHGKDNESYANDVYV